GHLVTWAQAEVTQQLDDGYVPIPSVVWEYRGLRLTVTPFVTADSGSSTLYVRYRLENHGDHGAPADLFIAIRPFQVTPPWQSLNMVGGLSRIQELRFDSGTVWVNRRMAIAPVTAPDHAGATTFEEGSITDFLLDDRVPQRERVTDPFGFAS